MDRNGDGFIDEDDMKQARGDAAPKVAQKGLLERYDKNGDGMIAHDEFPKNKAATFEKMDRNGDGFLDEQELRRSGAKGRRKQRGGAH